MKTIGISPKVKAFIAAIGGPGIILLALGVALNDDTLRTAGVTALAGAVIGGGAGAAAGPGEVGFDADPQNAAVLESGRR